jgi:ferritin-like metal-binding protein YciE
MKTESIRDLLKREVRDLLSSEGQVLSILPKMIQASGDETLRQALQEHYRRTLDQQGRLQVVASQLGLKPDRAVCHGMAGILAEGMRAMSETTDADVRDAVITAFAQRVEHYEIAAYATAEGHARILGEDRVAEMLEHTLREESDAAGTLSGIAENRVNEAAVGG